MTNIDNLRITVEHVNGTDRQIADAARTTIGLDSLTKEVSPNYMRKMYLCEHSPIRIKSFNILIENIPYWVAMHFVRHHVGVTPFVSTQRDDRQLDENYDRDTIGQGEPVKLRMVINSQAMIDISRKRLCNQAHTVTKYIWQCVLAEVGKVDSALVEACVPDCIYRGHCFEYKSCNYHQAPTYKEYLALYRRNINQ